MALPTLSILVHPHLRNSYHKEHLPCQLANPLRSFYGMGLTPILLYSDRSDAFDGQHLEYNTVACSNGINIHASGRLNLKQYLISNAIWAVCTCSS